MSIAAQLAAEAARRRAQQATPDLAWIAARARLLMAESPSPATDTTTLGGDSMSDNEARVADVWDALETLAKLDEQRRAGLAEGFCAEHRQPLVVTRLHDDDTGPSWGACPICQTSWRVVDGTVWVACCIPGQHTCGREKELCR